MGESVFQTEKTTDTKAQSRQKVDTLKEFFGMKREIIWAETRQEELESWGALWTTYRVWDTVYEKYSYCSSWSRKGNKHTQKAIQWLKNMFLLGSFKYFQQTVLSTYYMPGAAEVQQDSKGKDKYGRMIVWLPREHLYIYIYMCIYT